MSDQYFRNRQEMDLEDNNSRRGVISVGSGQSLGRADKNLTNEIVAAESPEEIRDLLHAAAKKAGVMIRDSHVASQLEDDFGVQAPASRPQLEKQIFTRTERIGNQDIVFESESELGLERQISAAHKVAAALQKRHPVEPSPEEIDTRDWPKSGTGTSVSKRRTLHFGVPPPKRCV